jgi:hypothetical protein
MRDPFDDELDPLLRNYLSSRLDPQLGRAAERFASQLGSPPSPRTKTPRTGRLLAAAAASAAAIAGAVWCGFEVGRQPPQPREETQSNHGVTSADGSPDKPHESEPPQIASTSPEETEPAENSHAKPLLVGQQFQWRTIDEGIVYLDPYTPVRKLRRQRLERVEWYDAARGARVQMIMPREEVQFVSLPSS